MSQILNDFLYKKNVLQQLKGFYHVARHNSISEAAKIMNLSQSTVTLQVQSLERDLKMKLFARDSKPLSLTEDGREFYKMICPLVHEFEFVIDKFLNVKKDEEQKKIDIAVHHVAISHLMPIIISRLKKIHPELRMIIRNIAPSEAIKRLKEGKIDLAFYPNLKNEPEIKTTEIVSYEPTLIMRKDHPLSKRSVKKLSELSEFDLIRIDQNLITLPLFEEFIKTHSIKGSVEFENGNWEMLKYFVKQNDFIAIVSSLCLEKNERDLEVKSLANFFPKMSYGISARSGEKLKPIIQDFVEVTLKASKEFALKR